MQKAKRIALWGLATLLSVVMIVALFLVVAGDDAYRWVLRQAIEGAIDREVHVDGTFSFDLFPHASVTATDVWIENAAWTGRKEMARAERVEIQVALKPLLSGILRVPRLVVQGVDVELEQSAEWQRNWDIGRPGASIDAKSLADPIYPLIDAVSLADITVTYRDRTSDREIILQLESLETQNERVDPDLVRFDGAGNVNQRPFQLSARLGTIEDAIAARAPYPVNFELQSTNFTFTAVGTVDDLPAAKGIDVSLAFRSPSLHDMLQTLQIDGRAFGPAQASARLEGDLSSLAVEEIDLSVSAPGGEELSAKGRIADLIRGEGLDLAFGGGLDPESLVVFGELPGGTQDIVDGLTELGISGQVTGSFKRLALQNLDLQVKHAAGAEIALQGQAVAGLPGGRVALAEFAATSRVFLPDEKVLVDALRERIPPMTNLEAVSELAWAGDWVELRSARVTGTASEDVEISGKGRIGRLSARDLNFDLDVQLDLKGSAPSSRPLFYLFEGFSPSKWRPVESPSGAAQVSAELILQIQKELAAAGLDPGAPDGEMGPATRAAVEAYQRDQGLTVDGRATAGLLDHLRGKPSARDKPASLPPAEPSFPMTEALPELGPIDASIELLFKDQVFRFQDLSLTLGSGGRELKTSGTLGRLYDGPEGILSEIDLQVSFATASSELLAKLLPPQAPRFTEGSCSFDISGTENLLSLTNVEAAATGPGGLRAAIAGGSADLDLENDPEVLKLELQLTAAWPDTRSVYDFVDLALPDVNLPALDLPELGPVQARATLKTAEGQKDKGIYALEEIAISAGTAEQPRLQASGSLADVAALTGVSLAGDFALNAVQVLQAGGIAADDELGTLRGTFAISDADGSLSLENLEAEIEDTSLLSLSLEGRLGDLKQADQLHVATRLAVPDLTALGRRLRFNAGQIRHFSYDGELSGSLETFAFKGESRLGETRIGIDSSGSLSGPRPAVKGVVSSSLVRLSDLGMVPDKSKLEELLETAPDQSEPPRDEWVFDETPIPFNALKSVDLDLDVDLQSVEGVQLEIDEIAGRIMLVDGRLSIDPLSFTFVGGAAEAKLHADAKEEPPRVHLEVSANNVHLARLLAQARAEVPLEGNMDVILDLKGKGRSPRDLASSLDGNTQLAIADGRVLTSLLSLTAANPVRWAFSKSAREGYSEMNCLILRFDVRNGLAESQALILDTPNMLADGSGQIDLRDETLQIDVVPRTKLRELVPVSIPFSIEGRLADPSIRVNSATASLRTGKEVLLSPLHLLGSLVPFVGNGGEGEDNPCLSIKNVTPTE